MTSPREWLARVRDWLRRDRLDGELTEELQFHRQKLVADLGEVAARRRLGNVTRVREEARERWSLPWLDHFLRDVRYALRGLRRSPGFTATVILTLGLGIGANAVMFGVVDRLMFKPFAYLRDPSTVHRVYTQSWYRGKRTTRWDAEYLRYLDLRRWTSSFSQYAAFAHRMMAVGSGDASRERTVAMVSASFFNFFDAKPVLGRFFAPAEDTTPRGADVAVLDYAFWKTEFGGGDVLGKSLQVDNILATIVGVAPEGFAGVSDDDPPAVYIPITTYAGSRSTRQDASTYYSGYNWRWMEIMVRRKPGVSFAQATADASRTAIQTWNARRSLEPDLPPAEIARPSAVLSALRIGAGPDPSLEARTALWVAGVALVVLIIACANVANLLLARALKRQREIALRLALGVSGRQLIAQFLTESVLLSLMGCAAALLLVQWGGLGVRRLLAAGPGAPLGVLTDWRTLGVAIGSAVAAGVLTGLAPALLSGRGDLAKALRTGGRTGTYQHSRIRVTLLVAQGALSVLLLVGAGLFVKSLASVKAMRLGYEPERVLLASGNLRGMQLDSSAGVVLGRRLLGSAQAIPGVEYASRVMTVPLLVTNSTNLLVPGIDSVTRLGYFSYQAATTDYFRTVGTRIIRGRGFTAEDRADSPPVAVVSNGMAKALWPGQDPIGRCIRSSPNIGVAMTMPCITVVGVAEDIVQRDVTTAQRLHYYLPIEQFAPPTSGLLFLIRTRGDAAQYAEAARRALQAEMPGQSYVTVEPLGDVVAGARRSWKLGATVFGAFGALALLVAAVGMYGVIAYSVAQRMPEVGVRIALGARSRDIVRLVVSQGTRLAALGATIGLGLALLAAPWIQPLLFKQSARDPAIYGMVGALIVLTGLLASAVPAFRATRADPNTTLRSD